MQVAHQACHNETDMHILYQQNRYRHESFCHSVVQHYQSTPSQHLANTQSASRSTLNQWLADSWPSINQVICTHIDCHHGTLHTLYVHCMCTLDFISEIAAWLSYKWLFFILFSSPQWRIFSDRRRSSLEDTGSSNTYTKQTGRKLQDDKSCALMPDGAYELIQCSETPNEDEIVSCASDDEGNFYFSCATKYHQCQRLERMYERSYIHV